MTTYAKATNVRVPYLTEGREYRVVLLGRTGFSLIADDGNTRYYLWNDDPDADFQRIEKEDA